MRHVLLATAAVAVLAGATAACGPIDTSAQAYHAYDGAATPSYGASGSAMAAAGGRNGDSGWLGGLTVISPNDPAYSYSEPPHRGQSTSLGTLFSAASCPREALFFSPYTPRRFCARRPRSIAMHS